MPRWLRPATSLARTAGQVSQARTMIRHHFRRHTSPARRCRRPQPPLIIAMDVGTVASLRLPLHTVIWFSAPLVASAIRLPGRATATACVPLPAGTSAASRACAIGYCHLPARTAQTRSPVGSTPTARAVSVVVPVPGSSANVPGEPDPAPDEPNSYSVNGPLISPSPCGSMAWKMDLHDRRDVAGAGHLPGLPSERCSFGGGRPGLI